ncbi:MAG: hypothetical protein JAY71_18755 [Candidatus Thiodiazotropha weberae]|nr:hypothetical protein [Candidatus Thiodiazotropha weberae]
MTQALRTGLGQTKDGKGKFLTWEDMEDAGVVTRNITGKGGGSGDYRPVWPDSGGGAEDEDRSPPPAPKNVAVNGAMTAIYITWDDPKLGYDYQVEIHKAAVDNVGQATLAGSGIGTIYQYVTGSDKTLYYFWVRFVRQLSKEVIYGPWHGTHGISGKAAEDPDWVLDQVSGKFDTEDLKSQTFSVDLFGVKSTDPAVTRFAFVVDTTVDPPLVAMDGASIVHASIGDAQIGNLNVDKLIGGTADFVEANIREGSITNAKIGNILQSSYYVSGNSGWHINKNGFVEFSDGLFRGRIESAELESVNIRGSTIQGGVIIGTEVYAGAEYYLVDPDQNGKVPIYYTSWPDIPVTCIKSHKQKEESRGTAVRWGSVRVKSPFRPAGEIDRQVTNLRARHTYMNWTNVINGSWSGGTGSEAPDGYVQFFMLDPYNESRVIDQTGSYWFERDDNRVYNASWSNGSGPPIYLSGRAHGGSYKTSGMGHWVDVHGKYGIFAAEYRTGAWARTLTVCTGTFDNGSGVFVA